MHHGLLDDVRHTARMLRRHRGFAAVAIATLALGIGATTAIFTVVKRVLIDPLPYPHADRLVRIVHSIGGIDQPYFNDAIALAYADNTQAFEDVGVWSSGESATVTGQETPEEVPALRASRGLLTTLGVQPEIGRWFTPAEDMPGAPNTVIVGHGYWQRRFGGDRTVLNRAITVDARPHQIVGVMPAGFRFDGDADLILPLRIDRGRMIGAFRLLGVARLKADVTLPEAGADASRVLHVWFETAGVKPTVRTRWAPSLRSLKQHVIGDVARTLWLLMGTVTIVLLVACANVATLLLVRADARQREFAIRAALGARWTRLTRQLLVENVTLAVVGGALGTGLAHAGLRLLRSIAPANLPRLAEVSLDPVVFGFALMTSVLSGVLFGLVPILRRPFDSHRRTLPEALGHGRSGGLTRDRQRSQQALVAVQVALGVILLVGAGLLIRSVDALRQVDPGFVQPHRLQTFSLSIPPTMVAENERVARLQQELVEKVARIPGVASAAYTTRVPMGSERSSAALAVEGRPDDGRTPPNRHVKIVSPGTFQTLGTPLIAGRDFTWAELYGARDIAIVSENLARELWGSAGAAVGRRVREYYVPRSPWREIVGVVGDVRDDGADRPAPPTIYWPSQPGGQFFGIPGYYPRRIAVVMRTARAGTESLVQEVHAAVWSVSADLPLAEVATLDAVYERSLARTAFTSVLLSIAGAMALLLGVTGLYGAIAYAVSQRRREIGIRLALGAQAREIRALFLRRSLLLVTAGVVMGLAGAASLSHFMRAVLFGVGPLDPLSFTAMPAVLFTAAMLASYLPAHRAAGLDPIETLRAD